MGRREDIILAISENPGIHFRGLLKKTGLENGVLEHYIHQLEKQGKVRSQKRQKYRRFYAVDVTEDEFPVLRNMQKPTKKKILFEIIVEGSPSFKDLIVKIGKSPSTLSWNLSELIDEGVIEKCKRNGKNCYRVKDKKLFKKTFDKEFSKLFKEHDEHSEDIFLAL